jgi:hypothetical protein
VKEAIGYVVYERNEDHTEWTPIPDIIIVKTKEQIGHVIKIRIAELTGMNIQSGVEDFMAKVIYRLPNNIINIPSVIMADEVKEFQE